MVIGSRTLRTGVIVFMALIGLIENSIAHPGHGVLSVPSESAAHYAFEPIHALPAIGVGLVLVYILRGINRRSRRRQCEGQ